MKIFSCVKPKAGKKYLIHVETTEDEVHFFNPEGKKSSLEREKFHQDDEGEVLLFDITEDELTEIQVKNYELWFENADSGESKLFVTSHNQFYINRTEYETFVRDSSKTDLQINVSGSPNHPEGYYLIPKSAVTRLIQSWEEKKDLDWMNNGKHSSSDVPTYLFSYWNRKIR